MTAELLRAQRREHAVAWLVMRREQGWNDHLPKRTCLGCGSSTPFGYMECGANGIRFGDFMGGWFTWAELRRSMPVDGQLAMAL